MLRGELFATEMVRAYQEGRKLHTARPVKAQPPELSQYPYGFITGSSDRREIGKFCWTHEEICDGRVHTVMPKHCPGDYIYCREMWRIHSGHRCGAEVKIEYAAGGPLQTVGFAGTAEYDAFMSKWYKTGKEGDARIWIPSIHMPQIVARSFFRNTDTTIMRLDDVDEQFAREDGFLPTPEKSALEQFREFWRSTYGDASWMWVYWMERCSREEAMGNA